MSDQAAASHGKTERAAAFVIPEANYQSCFACAMLASSALTRDCA